MIDDALIKLFVCDFQPFSVLEDEGFKEFVHVLNPAYQLPSRHYISKTAIPALYEECLTAVRDVVSSGTSFCLTTDCWTSINTTSYTAITAHFITENFVMRTVLLECAAFNVSHTSKHLASEIRRISREWGINDKIFLVVSDNAANISSAFT